MNRCDMQQKEMLSFLSGVLLHLVMGYFCLRSNVLVT